MGNGLVFDAYGPLVLVSGFHCKLVIWLVYKIHAKSFPLTYKIKGLIMKKALVLAALGAPFAAFAEGDQTVSISGLWGHMSGNFGTMINDCFTALETPVGIMLMVALTISIFYFVVRGLKRGFGRQSF